MEVCFQKERGMKVDKRGWGARKDTKRENDRGTWRNRRLIIEI